MAITFNRLLRAEFDELCPPKRDATDIGKDVVDDDQADGEEEPDHALEDVIHNEMRLHDDQVQGHMSPGKLGELKLVVAFLERTDKENEA
jgi:hypothetical protein